jgi:hypothetical protein
MSDLSRVNAVLIVFAMPGCGACEDYLPRFQRQLEGFQRLGHRFVYHSTGKPIAPKTIPVLIYDATSTDQGIQALADQYGVSGMPTTVLITRGRGSSKHEGSLDDGEIYDVLVEAATAGR